MGRGGQQPFPGQLLPVSHANSFHDLFQFMDTEKGIHFGELSFKLLPVALRKAAHDEQVSDPSGLLCPCKTEDGIDGFVLCIEDETAGVDDHGIDPLIFRGIQDNGEPVRIELLHENLGIHQVLGTSQLHDTDAGLPGS